jgi:hypothetical protein
MSDTWINWGDFIGKNQGQLEAYDAKVAASQAEQQAAMQAGLDRLGTDYENASKQTEDWYGLLNQVLYDNTKDTYRTPGVVPSQPDKVSGWGGSFSFGGAPSQGALDPAKQGNRVSPMGNAGAPIGQVAAGEQPNAGQFAFAGQSAFAPSSQSYSALMAAQNNAQANAFKGYQSPSAPGWQNALYSTRTQYVDPWANLQSKIDPITSNYDRRAAAAKSTYEANLADRKASIGSTGKVTGVDANGTPVYGIPQEDPGPRNVAIKPKKDLAPVVGYA